MNERALKQIDFDRHLRQLRLAVGGAASVALCDGEGSLLKVSPEGDSRLARALEGWVSERGELGATAGPVAAGGGCELAVAPVAGGAHAQGFLAVLTSEGLLATPHVQQALADVAESVGSELSLNDEVHNLAGELATRYEELNLVYSFEQHLSTTGAGLAGAELLLQNLVDFLDVDFAGFLMRGDKRPVYVTGQSELPSFDLVLTALRGDVFRFMAASRRSLVINEADDPRRQYLFINLPYRLLACPIIFESGVEAVLVMLRRPEFEEFSNSDRSIGEVLARQVGTLLRSRERIDTMRRFSQQMASALIEAIEAKDPYTRGHSERVQAISTRLAHAADLTGSDIESVSWGALLHDIGKLGIPDAILCKAGKLTEDEFTLIKVHPERGYEILNHIDGLNDRTLEAVRYHHEKYDGSGYPSRLGGASIPIHARVISVGDTYDAITSSRVYRPGQSHETALTRIRDASGTQLDPRLVEVFDRLCESSPEWIEELADARSGRSG